MTIILREIDDGQQHRNGRWKIALVQSEEKESGLQHNSIKT
jgi:hypothetical protein